MPAFVYKGIARDGRSVVGERVADSREAVMALLRREQIQPSSVKQKVAYKFKMPSLGSGVKAKDIAVFTRQFSVMIDAGLPLVQCLEILGGQQDNKKFATVLQATRADVEGGATLADAMRKHPAIFDSLYTNMIAAGEAGGILDTILKRLAQYIEKAVKLKSQIKGAMVYPIVVLGIAAIAVTIILWKVIPVFAAMFEGLNAQLPLPTRIVVGMSYWMGRLIVPMVLLGIVATFAFRAYYATHGGRRVIDRIVLRLPVIGQLSRKIAVARFSRTLSTLISSGVPILDGLEITARTSGNAIVEDAIMVVRKAVEGGTTVAVPLRDTKVFPNMVVQMVGVGEQTGALDAMLAKIADFYEDEVDQTVANLLTLMEPLMIMFLGVIIGGIVISMYLPLFEMINKLSG